MTEKEINLNNRRKKRKKQTAEVFTPDSLLNDMLNKLSDHGQEIWEEDPENTFLDPACGNGNFIVEILKRKLELGHNPFNAFKTIYGLDIMKDNIAECRIRLLNLISKYEEITKEHIKIVFQNIRWLSRKVFPNGTLDYDMSFKSNYNMENVDKWYQKIQNGEINQIIDLEGEQEDEEYREVIPLRDKNGKSKKVEDVNMFDL